MKKTQCIEDVSNPSSHSLDQESKREEEEEKRDLVRPVVKNRPWTGEEHLLYIIFLQIHKQRAKSKLVRHSNSFFKEMSALVQSKTEIQCRSHHHKYEEKYKYPYRIIKEQRTKLQAEGHSYLPAFEKIKLALATPETVEIQVKKEEQLEEFKKKVTTVSVDCQTSFEGTTLIFVTQEEFRRWYMPHPMSMGHPGFPFMNYGGQAMRIAPPSFFLRQ